MNLLTILFFAILSTLSEQRSTKAGYTHQPRVKINIAIFTKNLHRPENILWDQLPRAPNYDAAPNWLSTDKRQDNLFGHADILKTAIKCVIPIPCPNTQCKERFTVITDPSGCSCPRCVCILPCPACPIGYVAFNRDPSICQCPRCIPMCI